MIRSLNTLYCVLIVLAILNFGPAQAGRCVPFADYKNKLSLGGYNKPVCQSILEQSGITHIWVDESILPKDENLSPRDECYPEMYWHFDTAVSGVVNAFEVDRPSPICQNAFLSTFCFISFPLCEESTTNPGEFVKATRPLCHFLCQIFVDEVEMYSKNEPGKICNLDDVAWFYENELPLDAAITQLPQFKCDTNPLYAAPDDTNCIAPTFVKPNPVAGRCEAYTGDFCATIFPAGTQIFIPPGTVQSEIELDLQTNAYMFNLSPESSGCSEASLSLLCQTYFRECLDIGVKTALMDATTGFENKTLTPISTGIAFGLKPPLDTCTSFVNSCSGTPYFSQSGQASFDCDAAYTWNPSTCWNKEGSRVTLPRPQVVYTFNSKSYHSRYDYELFYTTLYGFPNTRVYFGLSFAASETYADALAIPYIECPSPTVLSPDTASTNIFRGRCALPCPTAAYTTAERKQITNAAWAFCIFSLAFAALLSFNFLIFKSQRHKRILFWFTLSYFVVPLMIFLGLVVTRNGSTWEKQCDSASDYEHMTGFGLFQGIFLIYFGLASMSWWFWQSVDLYQRLILGLQFRKGTSADKNRTLMMHLFSWGMPLICVIALIVGGQIGYDSYLPFAFITKDLNMTSNPIPLHYIFFMIPILALAITSYILVIIVLVYLVKYDPSGGLKKFQDSIEQSKGFWFKFTQSLKLFGFSFLMMLFIILMIVHQATIATHEGEWDRAMRLWGEEVVSKPFASETPVLTSRFPPGLIILTIFGFCSPGFFMFILYFVCSAEVYGLWFGLFYYKLGITWFRSIAREDTSTGGSDGSGSSHGSSTGKRTGGTTISNDLLTGGGDTALTARRVESKPESITTGSDSHPSTSAPTQPPVAAAAAATTTTTRVQSSTTTSKRDPPPRKNSLFKGFKSNKVPLTATNNSSGPNEPENVELSLLNSVSQSNLQSLLKDSPPVMEMVEEQDQEHEDHEECDKKSE